MCQTMLQKLYNRAYQTLKTICTDEDDIKDKPPCCHSHRISGMCKAKVIVDKKIKQVSEKEKETPRIQGFKKSKTFQEPKMQNSETDLAFDVQQSYYSYRTSGMCKAKMIMDKAIKKNYQKEKQVFEKSQKPKKLTDEQIAEWLRLAKLQNISRKWSVEGLSAQEAKKRKDALENYPKVMNETQEGKAEMMAAMEKIFYESDSENLGSLTGQDFWTMAEKWGAYYDTLEGITGHWILDKTVWDEFIDWFMKNLGTDGRMTFDAWWETWEIYTEKILPHLKE